MKILHLLLIGLLGFTCYGQETYYKNYKITNFIDFLKDGKNTYDYTSLSKDKKLKVKFLSREKCINYDSLSSSEKSKIDTKLKLVRNGVLPKIELKDCSGNILSIDKSNVDNPLLVKMIGNTITVRAKTFGAEKHNNTKYKAGLLMKEDKLYVNIWPFKVKENNSDDEQSDNGISKSDDDKLNVTENIDLNDKKETRVPLFYVIPDDHTAIFKFTELSVTAITIPLKYRFQTNRNAIDATDPDNKVDISVKSEEFSSSINLALFGGVSWGKTKFTHRKKIGNRTKTIKNTIGVFLGSSAVELKSTNTNITLTQLQGDREGTIGTVSFGLGYVKSWNKINIGLFLGLDKGVGRVSKSWVYDGKPWLGIGVGYDLFKM
jgi:hypothetical protein